MKRLEKYIPKDIPTGKILGKVTLIDCVKMSPKFKGKLSLWEYNILEIKQ